MEGLKHKTRAPRIGRCPFCGKLPRVRVYEKMRLGYVVCLHCKAHGPVVYRTEGFRAIREAAVNKWNVRCILGER